MSKLLVAIIQLLISLKLIKGWMLCEKEVLNNMAQERLRLEDTISEGEKALNLLNLDMQEKVNETEVHKTLTTNAVAQRDAAEKRCKDYERIERDLTSKLEEKESEVEIAASEILVLKESQVEATTLSKQLKEALDQWTS